MGTASYDATPHAQRQPLKWNQAAQAEGIHRLVFTASLADVFEEHPQLTEPRTRLWALIEETPALIWLLLTKRPENIATMVPPGWLETPPFNVWYGTSVENQEWADKRIPALLSVPATIRFLSCEPLLGAINLQPYLRNGIAWVIAGGESGAGARPMDVSCAYQLRDDCKNSGTAFFMKQMGSSWAKAEGGTDAKGGDIAKFPIGLRIREWPATHLFAR